MERDRQEIIQGYKEMKTAYVDYAIGIIIGRDPADPVDGRVMLKSLRT